MRLRLMGRAAFVSDARRAERALLGIDRGGRKAGTSFKTLDTASRGLNVSLGALGAATAAVGLGSLAAKAAGAGFAFNKLQDAQRVAFTTLLKGSGPAARFMQDIQDLALKSPVLDPASTGDAARLLMAYGIAAKDTLTYVEALGNMSVATGKSLQEVMPRGAMALGQIASKGRLQAEELNQLAESVGLSRKAISRELGMTSAEFNETFKPGNNLAASRVMPAILRAMQRQSGGAAELAAQTTAGQLARLQEQFARTTGALTRPLYDLGGTLAARVAAGLQGVAPKLEQLAKMTQGDILGIFDRTDLTLGQKITASIAAAKVNFGPLLAQLKIEDRIRSGLTAVTPAFVEVGTAAGKAFGTAALAGLTGIGEALAKDAPNGDKLSPGKLSLRELRLGPVGNVVDKITAFTGRAGGGTVHPGETTLVGERGPELARFPAGTRITPAGETRRVMASRDRHWQPVIVQLDGRVLAEVVAKVERTRQEAK